MTALPKNSLETFLHSRVVKNVLTKGAQYSNVWLRPREKIRIGRKKVISMMKEEGLLSNQDRSQGKEGSLEEQAEARFPEDKLEE